MPHNLRTLKHLMQENENDFHVVRNTTSAKRRSEAAERMVMRRRKMCTLAEELSLRTHRLQPIMKRLLQISDRVKDLVAQIAQMKKRRSNAAEVDLMQRELEELSAMDCRVA